MAPPAPPVILKNHCSIIYNDVLYVYSPDAFLTLPLKPDTQWTKEPYAGVSVTGATCVQGGVDGDNSKPALYVVGGSSSSSNYPGLQRYSILDKSWQTITPVVPVTQNRLHHGAAYMNASSCLVVYAGSQNDYDGPSTETFLIELYPPYRVQAYSSNAPPVIDPTMLAWSEDHAVMFGGGPTNTNVFLFGPADGWQNLGLALPAPLPVRSKAQSVIFTLDDGSKILETFDLSRSQTTVTRNVLVNPGGQIAQFNETIGGSASNTSKRATYLSNFPPYNSQFAPTGARSGFSLAHSDDGLITILGGDSSDSIVVFNGTGNTWLNANKVLSSNPQATLGTGSAATKTAAATPTQTSAPATPLAAKGHGLTVLGAVLGAICGAAAVLIILLLWLRSIRRRRQRVDQERRKSEYPPDTKRLSGEHSFDNQNLQPLANLGQPMGRSPVPSAVIDTEAPVMFQEKPQERAQEKRLSSALGQRLKLDSHIGSGMGFGQGMFKRDKSPLTISRPMAPDLGDYKERPSIELGKATPAAPAPTVMAGRKPSQRKTDEGWAKYFQPDGGNRAGNNRSTIASRSSTSTSRGAKGGFWPGSGVPEGPLRSPNMALRDSKGNMLQAQTVAAASPSLENGAAHARSRGLQVHQGMPAQISSGDSVSSRGSVNREDDEEEYEDDQINHAYSSGIPSSVPEHSWAPGSNTRITSSQRPPRPPSSNVSSAYPSGALPLPTSVSHETTNTSSSSGTKRSSIPAFPMPGSSIRAIHEAGNHDPASQIATIQHPAANHFAATTRQGPAPARPPRPVESGQDYFGPGQDGMPINSNLSWLNLNADGR